MWGESWGRMIWGSFALLRTMGPLAWTLLVGTIVGAAVFVAARRY